MKRRKLYLCLVALLTTTLLSPARVEAETYAFLVGVCDYSIKGQLSELKFAVGDVTRLSDTLKAAGVPEQNIVLMTDSSRGKYLPLGASIRREFELLLAETKTDDLVIVGLSGHGLTLAHTNESCFCPADVDLEDTKTLISLTDLYEQLASSKAGAKLLLVDACRDIRVRAIPKSVKRTELKAMSSRPTQVRQGGMIALFSCSSSERSFETPELESGVFFHFVNRAFSGEADRDSDGVLSIQELELFTVANVQQWTRLKLSQRQTPERFGTVRGLMPLPSLQPSIPGNEIGGGKPPKSTIVGTWEIRSGQAHGFASPVQFNNDGTSNLAFGTWNYSWDGQTLQLLLSDGSPPHKSPFVQLLSGGKMTAERYRYNGRLSGDSLELFQNKELQLRLVRTAR